MKILLSAYACEPDRGSEPAVGWHWGIELANLGNDVWVLTRANNKIIIDDFFKTVPKPDNLHFIYYDIPSWLGWWKKGQRGVRLYYLIWQWGAYLSAKHIHAKENFDYVHHVTFVSVRQPSFMGNLGIPFFFGPVAGGENTPWQLRFAYGFRGLVVDTIRDFFNIIVRFDLLMNRTFQQANKIYVTSEQTKNLIPKKYHKKTQVQLAIGIEKKKTIPYKKKDGDDFKILYIGRFLYLKGMDAGIYAVANFLKTAPNARMTMVGKGPEEKRWRLLAAKLGISKYIDWIAWVERKKLPTIFSNHDLLLFPSLHDSGGMVVLEAMSYGLPVICLDIGGPGEIVNNSCGIKIKTRGLTQHQVIDELDKALVFLKEDTSALESLKEGAIIRAKEFLWANHIRKIYEDIYQSIIENQGEN